MLFVMSTLKIVEENKLVYLENSFCVLILLQLYAENQKAYYKAWW
jgi:hypothetical protein